jgi:hypothetical protein
LLSCVPFLTLLFLTTPCKASSTDYLTQLTQQVRRERLAESREWQTLLRYKPRFFGGVESQVDAPEFFLAPGGKTDPQAELEATLGALFADDRSDPELSVQCTFPARYQWLKERLQLDPDRLPELSCGPFDRWMEELQPQRITLIFPSAYLNNPASMFGHTLLRIDGRGQDEQTRLLAQTINYAARSGQAHGIPYAFNGLFGRFSGRYSMAPYYLKVRAYGDMENRDIWEYGLDLTGEELDRLLRHVWEMRSAGFDYYFLDENCSYHLLSLLEAARPELRLTDRFSWWAIPSETVRAVAEAGLLEEVRFRPSRNTILRQRASLMDAGLQRLAKRLTLGELGPDSEETRRLPPADQARVIELAVDYAAYRQNVRFGGAPQTTATVSRLLEARSRLDAPDQTPAITAPEVLPGQGHKPARAEIGYGFEDSRHFIEVTAAPGYHDLFDPQGGFTRGAQVIALRTALRYYPEENRAELERLDILDIMSLSPWDRFLQPVSWKFHLGIGRKHFESSDRLLLGRINTGFGISRDLSDRTSAHAFAEGTLEMSDRFDYFVAPGVGPGLGLMHDFTDKWRTGVFFQWRYFALEETRNDFEILARNRFAIGEGSIVGLDLSWKRHFDHGFAGGTLYWQLYF